MTRGFRPIYKWVQRITGTIYLCTQTRRAQAAESACFRLVDSDRSGSVLLHMVFCLHFGSD